jgi:hypothetical protein
MPSSKPSKKASASSIGGSSSTGYKKGPVTNGFRTILEDDPLKVDPENIAPFSLPAEAFQYEPTPEVMVTVFKTKDKERKIYCNTLLDQLELDQLKKLQEEAEKQKLYFLPSITVMASRFLSRARGDPQQAIKLMLATQSWRLEFFKEGPVADADILEDLKHGIVYFAGRDFALRPTIMVRANRIPQQWYKEKRIDKLIKVLIFCMEYMLRYMVCPGRIENNCLIVDLKGLSFWQVPISALKEVYNVMSKHYIGRVFKFYICNMSSGLSTIASVAKAILTDRQQQKLNFIDDLKVLRQDFAAHQLEEDLGGTRPVIKTFYPFPMQGGPYEAGASSGPSEDAIPDACKMITRAGAEGRLWDSTKTPEENSKMVYMSEAYEWFKENKLDIPADCQRQRDAEEDAAKAAEEAAKAKAEALANGEEIIDAQDEIEEPEEEEEEDMIILEPEVIKPNGLFCCCASS